MPEIEDTIEAQKAKLREQWEKVMEESAETLIAHCEKNGLKPEWFYPRQATVVDDHTLSVTWSLRPEILHALGVMATDGSAELAAVEAVAKGQRALDELVEDDSKWN